MNKTINLLYLTVTYVRSTSWKCFTVGIWSSKLSLLTFLLDLLINIMRSGAVELAITVKPTREDGKVKPLIRDGDAILEVWKVKAVNQTDCLLEPQTWVKVERRKNNGCLEGKGWIGTFCESTKMPNNTAEHGRQVNVTLDVFKESTMVLNTSCKVSRRAYRSTDNRSMSGSSWWPP